MLPHHGSVGRSRCWCGDEGTALAVPEHPACHRRVLPRQRCLWGGGVAGSEPLPEAEQNCTIALFVEVLTYKSNRPLQGGPGNAPALADVTPRDGHWCLPGAGSPGGGEF